MSLPVASTLGRANTASTPTESIVLGGGCFWCVEAVLERLPGVKTVVSGYAGGHTTNPDYRAVCTGSTGHAEVVHVEFDPTTVTLPEILKVFFAAHDPTTLNRQGADAGTQYRSAIYYTSDAQHQAALAARDVAQKGWPDPIVTEIAPLNKFYPAEEYHQDYFRRNPSQGYCAYVIRPKVEKLEHKGVIPAGKSP